jgi:tetratricopeptide (TPR) repeat protein
MADFFDLQDEIVARLANALEAQLFAAEARRAEEVPGPDSMDLYFRGLASVNKGVTTDNLSRARGFFERAVAIDPCNVDALAMGAYVDSLVAFIFAPSDRMARFAAAEEALTKALSLAPANATAHLAMALFYVHTNRAGRSIPEFERALKLNRNLAGAHAMMGTAKLHLGRAEETESHVREALRLSPHDTYAYVWLTLLGTACFHLGRDAEALVWLRQAIETNRNFHNSHFALAAVYAHMGDLDEARAALAAGLSFDPCLNCARIRANSVSANARYLKQRERYIEGLRMAGLPEV